jgi:hypothetical protein
MARKKNKICNTKIKKVLQLLQLLQLLLKDLFQDAGFCFDVMDE